MTPQEAYETARRHYNRFLLPRGRSSQDEGAYRACEALVASGHAQWLPFWSLMAPGIRLTGKPFDLDPPAPPA